MKSQAVVEFGKPLQAVESETPTPQDSEVLVEVVYCGACHSDVHLHDGYFDAGDGNKIDTSKRPTPFTLGHEIEGVVSAVGSDVKSVKVGERVVVFPWIGCGKCRDCENDREHICNGRGLGTARAGGFASHCLVPHERYCLNADGITPGLAATYMCSGITAYSALKHLRAFAPDEKVLIIGLGGVGMMALQFALAILDTPPLVADIDANKLQAALGAGAAGAYNAKDEDVAQRILADTNGGVAASTDFVGSEASFGLANRVVRRGGEMKTIGLYGGLLSMPLPHLPLRNLNLTGTMVGTLGDTKEMLELVKAGKVNPIPIETRDMAAADQTLDDLRNGKIIGRVVLKN